MEIIYEYDGSLGSVRKFASLFIPESTIKLNNQIHGIYTVIRPTTSIRMYRSQEGTFLRSESDIK